MLASLHHLLVLSTAEPTSDVPPGLTSSPTRRCSQAEHDRLRDILMLWRDRQWAAIRADNPLLSPDWVMDNLDIGTLVSKAHVIVGAHSLNASLINKLVTWMADEETMLSLISVVCEFHDTFRAHAVQEHPQMRGAVGLSCLWLQVHRTLNRCFSRKSWLARSFCHVSWYLQIPDSLVRLPTH